jgi:hypothetical protein
MDDKEQLEQQMSQSLTAGEMAESDPEAEAQARLTPRYEIRITASRDPIVEETLHYRSMAEEVDSRYDKYMSRTKQGYGGDDQGKR